MLSSVFTILGVYTLYGAGPGVCFEETFARAELNCLIAGLFGRFRIGFEGLGVPGVTEQVTVACHGAVRVCVEGVEEWRWVWIIYTVGYL